jgi:S-methylmethionine-dependent homocysteine/selenocysteine methylase
VIGEAKRVTMHYPNFAEAMRQAPVMLTDGGIETRLIYQDHLTLPDFASFLPLFDASARGAIEALYRSYFDIAADTGLPMQISTPTWRAHPEGLARQGFTVPSDLHRVNAAAVALLRDLRAALGLQGQVFIAGVIGPRRDGYDPHDAPDAGAARDYHGPQAACLAGLGVDLLYAPTFASADELRGVAAAMAATGLPYALAPVIDADGVLLDGTPLTDAIGRIDAAVAPRPLHYLIGCVHPTTFRKARQHHPKLPDSVAGRVVGLKANASNLPPDLLDKLDHLEEGRPEDFADLMLGLHRNYGLRVLGGCCGTDDRHIRAIASRLVAAPSKVPARSPGE